MWLSLLQRQMVHGPPCRTTAPSWTWRRLLAEQLLGNLEVRYIHYGQLLLICFPGSCGGCVGVDLSAWVPVAASAYTSVCMAKDDELRRKPDRRLDQLLEELLDGGPGAGRVWTRTMALSF